MDVGTQRSFTLNGVPTTADVDGRKSLLRYLRDDLGMMQQLGLLPATSHAAGDMSRPAL